MNRGGLSRGRGFTEVQQAVGLLSRTIRTEVTNTIHKNLLQLNSGSSKQYVELGKTSQKRSATEYLNSVFDLGNTNQSLENFVTGREASPSVNIFNAKKIGQVIDSKILKIFSLSSTVLSGRTERYLRGQGETKGWISIQMIPSELV